jgi:hypothetical protein
MRKQRDFQRSKVYAWERQMFPQMHTENLNLYECKLTASNLYGKRVKVKDGRGRRNACAFARGYPTIALPKWARNEVVICHEVAHLLHRFDDTPWHGARFMRSYIELLDLEGLHYPGHNC